MMRIALLLAASVLSACQSWALLRPGELAKLAVPSPPRTVEVTTAAGESVTVYQETAIGLKLVDGSVVELAHPLRARAYADGRVDIVHAGGVVPVAGIQRAYVAKVDPAKGVMVFLAAAAVTGLVVLAYSTAAAFDDLDFCCISER